MNTLSTLFTSLIEYFNIVFSEYSHYDLLQAVRRGNLNVVNTILEDPRINPADDGNCAIGLASFMGHLLIVNRLLEDSRVDPSIRESCTIGFASRGGHLAVVNRLLQDHRINPAGDDNYAIRFACYGGHLDVVNRLLEDHRVDPSAGRNSAIFLALLRKNTDIIGRLLCCRIVRSTINPSSKTIRSLRKKFYGDYAIILSHLNTIRVPEEIVYLILEWVYDLTPLQYKRCQAMLRERKLKKNGPLHDQRASKVLRGRVVRIHYI
jgi:hypothetical protein